MRFTFPAAVWDDDRDGDGDGDGVTPAAEATPSSHPVGAHQPVPGQRPPSASSASATAASPSSPAGTVHPDSSSQRDEAEAEALRSDLLARLQKCSVTDADWENASSSSSDDEPDDDDDPGHHNSTYHAARLTGLQGSVEANRDAAANTTATTPASSVQVASNSAAARQQPCPPSGRGHDPGQASRKRKSEPLQNSRRAAGDGWVRLGRGKARPLGPGAPGLTVTRPDGAVFALRPTRQGEGR